MEYSKEVNNKLTERLRELLDELPPFCRDFFRASTNSRSIRTRVGYAYDLKVFFKYLTEDNTKFMGRSIKSLTTTDLEEVKAVDIDDFLDYVTYYQNENKQGRELDRTNDEKGKSRKLAAVRSMLKYFYQREVISDNPGTLISTPKIHEKDIIRLEPDEVSRLLDNIESGEGMTKREIKYHDKTAVRDLAIVTLLLGTGMRVSECVGIDLKDLDFNMNAVRVVRKGGNTRVLYFGEEVEKALKDYIMQRNKIEALEGSEDALFLSLQKKRITDRAIQNLVKKYASTVTSMKKITPHKLRSTFGTELYMESGDIYLVADALGHADVNTTSKHYARMMEERRRSVPQFIKLREE